MLISYLIYIVNWLYRSTSDIDLSQHEFSSRRDVYQYAVELCDGSLCALSALKGKVILVVNTSSADRFISMYEDLEHLWQLYAKQGLVIIAVPSDDFDDQLHTQSELSNILHKKYNISYLVTKKMHVKGQQAHVLFRRFKDCFGYLAVPQTAHYKYIIDRKGRIACWFSPQVNFKSKRLSASLVSFLERNP